jgi:hypothetical protein
MNTTAVSLFLRLKPDVVGDVPLLDALSKSAAMDLCGTKSAAAVETVAVVRNRRREVFGLSVVIMFAPVAASL